MTSSPAAELQARIRTECIRTDRRPDIFYLDSGPRRIRVAHDPQNGVLHLHGVGLLTAELDPALMGSIELTAGALNEAQGREEQESQRILLGVLLDRAVRRHKWLADAIVQRLDHERFGARFRISEPAIAASSYVRVSPWQACAAPTSLFRARDRRAIDRSAAPRKYRAAELKIGNEASRPRIPVLHHHRTLARMLENRRNCRVGPGNFTPSRSQDRT